MSRLNLEALNCVWVSESIETLTFFFFPGEMKNKKGEIIYEKKKEFLDKKKVDAKEQYLQVARSEEVDKQVLSFYLNDERVARFEFTETGVDFVATSKWNQPKMYICIPTDLTWKVIKAETLAGVFKQWLQTERFDNYLISQATDSTYTVAFVNLVLLFLACLCNREKVNERGEIIVIKSWKDLDLEAIAKSYLLSLTKLHNSSPRAKQLFPIRPLLSPSTQPIENQPQETLDSESVIEVVPDEEVTDPLTKVDSAEIESRSSELEVVEVEQSEEQLDIISETEDKSESKSKKK